MEDLHSSEFVPENSDEYQQNLHTKQKEIKTFSKRKILDIIPPQEEAANSANSSEDEKESIPIIKERRKKRRTKSDTPETTKDKMLKIHSQTAKLMREQPIRLPQVKTKQVHSFASLLGKIKERDQEIAKACPKASEVKEPDIPFEEIEEEIEDVGDEDYENETIPSPKEDSNSSIYDESVEPRRAPTLKLTHQSSLIVQDEASQEILRRVETTAFSLAEPAVVSSPQERPRRAWSVFAKNKNKLKDLAENNKAARTGPNLFIFTKDNSNGATHIEDRQAHSKSPKNVQEQPNSFGKMNNFLTQNRFKN